MGIHFEWQAGSESGDWETIARTERRRRRLHLVRWWVWVLLAAAVLGVAGGAYLIVHRRYAAAQRRLAFQIQAVIDLEARAFAQGDADLLMAQQDLADTTWRIRQKQRISTFCTPQPVGAPPERCAPVLPAQVDNVELQRQVAWVQVIQGPEPVRRVRFYRRTLAGWVQTSPQAAFWRDAVEFAAPGLTIRYHERDRPAIDPLMERIAQAHRQACQAVSCAADALLEVEFAIDVPPRTWPDPTGRRLTLASPWLSGIPIDGRPRPADLDALSYQVAHAVALQRIGAGSARQSDPLQSVLLTEYAAWSAYQDITQAPILGRIAGQRGVDALPKDWIAWLQDDATEHTLRALLDRFAGLTPDRDRVAYFQMLLDTERLAIVSGRKDTFLFLQDTDSRWRQLQQTFYERAPSQPDWLARSAVRVQNVEIDGDLALVTLDEPPAGIHGLQPQTLGQYAFFSLQDGDWRHTTLMYAVWWDIPLAQLRMPAALPASRADAGDPGAMTIAFLNMGAVAQAQLQAWVSAFQEGYPQIRVQAQDLESILYFPDMEAPLVTDIWTIYELLAYQAAWMADATAWPLLTAAPALPLWRDLTPLVEMDGGLAFYPFMLAPYQPGGSIWTLPWIAQPVLIQYDRAAFDAAGAPYPHPGWTQDEFLSIARQMTARDGDHIARYGLVDLSSWPMARAWIEGRAGPLMDRSQAPQLDSPQAIEAVRWYTDLALRYRVMPAIDAGDGLGSLEPYQRLVNNGQAAMWTTTAASPEPSGLNRKLGLVSYPAARYGANPWQVSGLMISALTSHARESWLWVRYLSDQSAAGSATSLPARPAVAEAAGYWEQWDSEMRAVLQDAVDRGWAFRLDGCTFPLQQAIDAIWKGQTVEAALAEAQESAARGRPRQVRSNRFSGHR